jgi:hypothetical protein
MAVDPSVLKSHLFLKASAIQNTGVEKASGAQGTIKSDPSGYFYSGETGKCRCWT